MSEASSEPVKTFRSDSKRGFQRAPSCPPHCRTRRADHHEFIVRRMRWKSCRFSRTLRRTYADSSAIPTYYVARETRQHVTVALNGDGGTIVAGYERYAAMQLAERYHRLPASLRKLAIQPAIGLLPSSETSRSRIRDAKRFIQAASLPKRERYLRWVSVFDAAAKQELYSADFQRQTANVHPSEILDPWFAHANGSGIVDAALLTDIMTICPTTCWLR